jgi:hypothetical protein
MFIELNLDYTDREVAVVVQGSWCELASKVYPVFALTAVHSSHVSSTPRKFDLYTCELHSKVPRSRERKKKPREGTSIAMSTMTHRHPDKLL